MRRLGAVLALAIAGLVPLVRYQPSTEPAHASPGSEVRTAPPPTSSAAGGRTIDGSVVRTEYGPYQVRVVFTGNEITDAQLITEPSDRHSRRIADSAAPVLRQEALQAQSAKLDAVSGATTTSEAYAESLQAAIDTRSR
ncbi:FMN-binding protein [Saccharopolyspora oryzae]|uniref:FMN-binding protein n=1 Tax=Saccharopolyspora oryzae TaxID=2997343 RepID=A0ABT4V729_9PSEU|nr:FMN-binding protein [Saccharopolyspora oryzae]MDA3629771.1 FMN-binding protein [Saccharopolyspora oryzae]